MVFAEGGMKNIFILLLLFLLFLLNSCTPYNMVENSSWKGKSEFDTVNYEITIIFNTDKTAILYYESEGHNSYYKIKGDYVLNSDYSFSAEFKKNKDFDGDSLTDYRKVEIKGTLDYQNGYGDGKVQIDYDNTFDPDVNMKGDWELTKM